jgi:hypothetical protein
MIQPFDIILRTPRKVDLTKAGRTEMQDAGTEHVGLAVGASRNVAPIVQRRNQVMAGRDVQTGNSAYLREFCFAAGIGNNIQDEKGTIEGLYSALVASHRRARGHHAVGFINALEIHKRSPPNSFYKSNKRPIPIGQQINFRIAEFTFIR